MDRYIFKRIDEDHFAMTNIWSDGKTFGPYIKTTEEMLEWVEFVNSQGCLTEIEF